MADKPPSPGWYEAPDGQRRWWDGTTWGPTSSDDDATGDAAAVEPDKPWTGREKTGCLIAIVLIALLFTSCTGWLFSGGSSDRQDEFGAYDACRQVVRRQLVSPATASFPSTDSATVRQSGSTWHVAAWVDADNAYGASIRHPWTCTAEWRGDGSWTARATVGG
jgi:hypothetical protein